MPIPPRNRRDESAASAADEAPSPAASRAAAVRFWMERLSSLLEGPRASAQLAALGADAVPALREFLLRGSPASVFQPRQWAVEALAAASARDALLEYIERDPIVVDPVVRQGEDAVRSTAARLLATWRTDEVYATLLAAAERRILAGVVWALGQFRRLEALPVLERALEDGAARADAEDALRQIGDAALPALVTCALRRHLHHCLETPSSLLRRRAALRLLAEIPGGAGYWPRLRRLCDEDDAELVTRAVALCVAADAADDTSFALEALLRVLPRVPWYVQQEAVDCLRSLYRFSPEPIEREIQHRSRMQVDIALSLLLRARSSARSKKRSPPTGRIA